MPKQMPRQMLISVLKIVLKVENKTYFNRDYSYIIWLNIITIDSLYRI